MKENENGFSTEFILIILVVLIVFGFVGYRLYVTKQSATNGQVTLDFEKTTDYQPKYYGMGRKTSKSYSSSQQVSEISGAYFALQDSRPSDGGLGCTIFDGDSRLILADYSISSGFNPQGKVYRHITYRTNKISKNKMDKLLFKYCGS